jgi:gamma-glutamyltranspeptidase / glutathione hydrolase
MLRICCPVVCSGVPGEIRGLEHLHKNYGRLPWATVMRPAIQLARNGFPISEDLFRMMNEATQGQPDFLVEDPSWAIDFAPNGTRLGLGDIITRKRLANTLERIAEDGPDAFYTGTIANSTIAALRASNGTMVLEDLRDYKVVMRKPVQIKYRDYKLTAGAAPSGGSVVLSVMNIIKGFPDMGNDAILNLSTHRLVEAMRFGYGMVRAPPAC